MTTCKMTVLAALLAGMFLGCNKPEPVTPTPPPAVTLKPAARTTAADDALLNSGPPTGGTPITSIVPATPTSQPAAGTKKYTVKKGDTLINIARTELGNEHRLKEIQTLNPGLEPSKLKVGQEILIPAK
jgi:LysM repeat protein